MPGNTTQRYKYRLDEEDQEPQRQHDSVRDDVRRQRALGSPGRRQVKVSNGPLQFLSLSCGCFAVFQPAHGIAQRQQLSVFDVQRGNLRGPVGRVDGDLLDGPERLIVLGVERRAAEVAPARDSHVHIHGELIAGAPMLEKHRGSEDRFPAGGLADHRVAAYELTWAGADGVAGAQVTKLDGRRIDFKIEATEGVAPIGIGTHERMVIDMVRFVERLKQNSA